MTTETESADFFHSDPPDLQRVAQAEAQIHELQKVTDYEIREWPIEVLVDKFTNGRETDEAELFIPDYQREMVWTAHQQSRFIESILIRLPIPFLFTADVAEGDRAGKMELVDGSQRLRTLENFLSNRLRLEGLTKLDAANGLRFSDLPKPRQMRFKRHTVRVIELTDQADDDARREMFDRLNSGGTKLKSMEIRRGALGGLFMDFVTECSKHQLFMELVPIGERNAKHREGEEMVLRYFAYSHNYQAFQKRVDTFLDDFLKAQNGTFDDVARQKLLEEFEHMLHFVKAYFPDGFKRSARHSSVPRIRFEALSVGVTLALRERPDLVPADVTPWLEAKEFITHTRSDASNSRPKLFNRIHYVRDNLLGNAVTLDPDTALVERSANAEAPADEPQAQGSLW